MADEVDQANDIEQALLLRKIKTAQNASKAIDTHNPSGICWSCEAETGTERRWCDADCMKDWSKNND